MDDAVRSYIDAVDPAHRPLFDRVHRLIMAAHPGAEVVLSYQVPTYKVGRRRLYVGAWGDRLGDPERKADPAQPAEQPVLGAGLAGG
jgi:hypothetical protein